MTSYHCPTCFGITRLDSENVRWCRCPTTRDKDAEIARLRELVRSAWWEGNVCGESGLNQLDDWSKSNTKKELERQ